MPVSSLHQGLASITLERWACRHCGGTIDTPTETRKHWNHCAHVNRPCGCWAPIVKVDD
jgi:hypothetical protein